MHCGEDDSSPYAYQHGPYSYSLASSASSSSASVFSQDDSSSASVFSQDDTSSQSSCDSDECPPISHAQWPKKLTVEIPAEQRQNPRRSSSGCPPALVRQSERKVTFVDSLVGKKYDMFNSCLSSPPNQIPPRKSLKRFGPFLPLLAEARWAATACFLCVLSSKKRCGDQGQVTRPSRLRCTT